MYVLPSSLFVTQSFSEYSKALLPNITSKEIYGAEFSTYDYGQKTLLPAINDRHGQVTGWNFEYLGTSISRTMATRRAMTGRRHLMI